MHLGAGPQVPLAQSAYDRMAFHEAAAAATAVSGRCNQLLQETAPWSAFKKVGHRLPAWEHD